MRPRWATLALLVALAAATVLGLRAFGLMSPDTAPLIDSPDAG